MLCITDPSFNVFFCICVVSFYNKTFQYRRAINIINETTTWIMIKANELVYVVQVVFQPHTKITFFDTRGYYLPNEVSLITFNLVVVKL